MKVNTTGRRAARKPISVLGLRSDCKLQLPFPALAAAVHFSLLPNEVDYNKEAQLAMILHVCMAGDAVKRPS